MNGLKIVRSIPAMFLSTPHNLTHAADATRVRHASDSNKGGIRLISSAVVTVGLRNPLLKQKQRLCKRS